ncbi:hypothetical protein PG993_008739 [Apiospora rasikravindrae]|uniref:Uncharacterized protein n=1 Tax=Apiospora rasikravindrae TaxID=990691 RepID=A0ABR1SQX7_9PEZI
MGGAVMNGPYHGRTLSGVDQGAASNSSPAAALTTKLSAAKFVLAISEHGVAAGHTPATSNRKLVLSNKLAISDMSTMTLASLRERLLIYARVPLFPSKHIFCTATGVEVTDESITVADYLQLESRNVERKAGLPAISVYYKTHRLEGKQAGVRFA